MQAPPIIGPPGTGPVQCVHEIDPSTGKCKRCGRKIKMVKK